MAEGPTASSVTIGAALIKGVTSPAVWRVVLLSYDDAAQWVVHTWRWVEPIMTLGAAR